MRKNMLKIRNTLIIIALMLAVAASLSACKKDKSTDKLPNTSVETSAEDSSATGEGGSGAAADGAQTGGSGSASGSEDAGADGSGSNSNDGSGGTILEDEGELEITVPDGIETYGE